MQNFKKKKSNRLDKGGNSMKKKELKRETDKEDKVKDTGITNKENENKEEDMKEAKVAQVLVHKKEIKNLKEEKEGKVNEECLKVSIHQRNNIVENYQSNQEIVKYVLNSNSSIE